MFVLVIAIIGRSFSRNELLSPFHWLTFFFFLVSCETVFKENITIFCLQPPEMVLVC